MIEKYAHASTVGKIMFGPALTVQDEIYNFKQDFLLAIFQSY